jgi:hypothetical protein
MPWPWNKCKPIISYDSTTISFSGLETDEIIRFKIGELKINKELLQAATDTVKVYDIYRIANCHKLSLFSKNSPIRDSFILETMKSEQRLLELLLILRLASVRTSRQIEKSLADWIAFTSRSIGGDGPIIPHKVKGGEIVREAPPIEEYNNLKRSIAKARNSSEFLRAALESPRFNIESIYAMGFEQ